MADKSHDHALDGSGVVDLEGSAVPHAIRPGDVLADRYRLVDLLSESGSGRFWRAHDRVLERHVALHVLDADDERAPGLMEAARRSAAVVDRRLLRVLDADEADGLCYVVNEWGSGTSLDIMLANEGPLAARRAAWLVSEVADSIAAAHRAGVVHGRLVPENVLVDHTGTVRVIGCSVDAALHGLPPGRVSADVTDLAALLYAALTAKWPGVSGSVVPAAPQVHGRVLRPRQVRAGIPRPLDALCDEVINPYAGPGSARLRDTADLGTAQGISDFLLEFVGDPTGLAEVEASLHASRGAVDTVVLPALTDPPVRPAEPDAQRRPQPDAEPDAEPDVEVGPAPEPDPEPTRAIEDPEPTEAVETAGAAGPKQPDVPATPASGSRVEQPTQAGLPIFDDENDDVSWLTARSEPAPPPPPFEPPPERPLFAPDPATGEPARRPRPTPTVRGTGPDFWPWDTSTGTGTGTGTGTVPPVPGEEKADEVPGRSWLRLAALLGIALLLLVAIVVAYNLGRGRTPLGAVPEDDPSPTPSPSATAAPTLLKGLTADDLDPQGDPPEENPEEAPLAVDGDAGTAWVTSTYDQQLGPGGLKTGVGLVLDLGAPHAVSSVDLVLGQTGTTGVALYVTDQAPTAVRSLTPVQQVSVDGRARVDLDQPVTGRYLTVWLTSLPEVQDGFRGEVAEVAVRG